MRRLLKKVMLGLMVMGLVLASASLVLAINITSIDGDWSNRGGGLNVTIHNDTTTYSTGDTATIQWGGAGSYSSYVFVTSATPISNVATNGSPIALGEFTHNNFPIPSGSGITSVDLDLALGITGLNPISATFLFHHNETPNSYYPDSNPGNDDIVTITNPVLNASFVYDNTQYYFNLLGFYQNGQYTNTFYTVEGNANKAILYGEITSEPINNPVPEPGTMALLGVGMLGLAVFGKRRMNRNA